MTLVRSVEVPANGTHKEGHNRTSLRLLDFDSSSFRSGVRCRFRSAFGPAAVSFETVAIQLQREAYQLVQSCIA